MSLSNSTCDPWIETPELFYKQDVTSRKWHFRHNIASRGVMPIQSAHNPSDFWDKWILNAASKRQKIDD